jgi:outer membrane protein OmpA-like peptidoglycan-associated protein
MVSSVGLWLLLSGAGMAADVVSRRDIEAALAPSPVAEAERPRTRGIVIKAIEERKEVIDLNIPFEVNSAQLQPQAAAQLEQLGAALKSASLGRSRFQIGGHTDSSGDPDYNRRLSERRADTVRKYLISHGVDAARLEATGFGKDRPLTPEDPTNAVNRRVEIRNLGAAP